MARRTEQTFKKMDEALKLKAGMLLGEMEMAKDALQGCIERNQALSTQMAMVWVLGDAGLLGAIALLVLHQKRMRQEIRQYAKVIIAKYPEFSIRYVPSSALFRWAIVVLILLALGLNMVALFL
jgi:phosphohistidine phosphatase SixA